MKGLLKIDGKEIEIELTEEQTKTVNNALKPKLTGWERVPYGITYYRMDMIAIEGDSELQDKTVDDTCYEIANYFSTEEKAKEVAFETELFRKLKRFADENNEIEVNWKTMEQAWCIQCKYGILEKERLPDAKIELKYGLTCRDFGQIYFSSKEIAEKALETFRPELEKYFGINQK